MKCKTEALEKLQLFYIYSNSATMNFITDSGENAEKKTSQDLNVILQCYELSQTTTQSKLVFT